MRPYIVANWKMHGVSADIPEISKIDEAASHNKDVDVALALPATLLGAAQNALHTASLGAQDCHHEAKGAHTGCLSATMLAEAGANFSIVGHSERRTDQSETSPLVAAKARTLQHHEMGAIICIGEDLETRQSGEAEAFVSGQLIQSLTLSSGTRLAANFLTIAYEPIWAIGTGMVPGEADITAMHGRIRKELEEQFGSDGTNMRILYGGSVKASNASAILSLEHVNGALVGGASLKADSFIPIINAGS